MNTPTHLLINWFCAEKLADRLPEKRFPLSAVLWGSVAPDLALYGLVIGGSIWFGWVKQWPAKRVATHMFGDLFFHDPVWIALHNSLHSPTFLLAAIGITWWYRRRVRRIDSATESVQEAKGPEDGSGLTNSWWMWFWGSCLLHTLVDIPVHHDDGPLVFWPIDWSYRFASPVSYWDQDHFGGIVMLLEGCLVLCLLCHRLLVWWRAAIIRRIS